MKGKELSTAYKKVAVFHFTIQKRIDWLTFSQRVSFFNFNTTDSLH